MKEITYSLYTFMLLTLVTAQGFKGGQRNIPRPPYADGRMQCPPSVFPSSPESGCCGLEASAAERAMAQATTPRPVPTKPDYQRILENLRFRFRRNANDSVISIGSRITGGSETDFFDFPWTVRVLSTFNNERGQRLSGCGGSLISSRYVLTAAHCVKNEEMGTLTKVQVHLAEYDTTTFPEDCKIVRGVKQCIRNIAMQVEEVISHAQYDSNSLHNDIALLRLAENAPYTPYIRPICLPPIDVENAYFENTRLAVAGWGLNGEKTSNIKQSTVLNLVLQKQCRNHYFNLIRSQMCAAGYSGEDTCQGDSGGPLMMADGQKYYVVGIVSGKRADEECGSSVPSLYTNVYQFLDWIHAAIRE